MRRSDVFRTGTFRAAMLAAGVFALCTVLLFAFIYWQTAGYEAARIDQFLLNEAAAIAREPSGEVERDVRTRFAGDLHRLTFAAILSPAYQVTAGELAAYPAGLVADGVPQVVDAARTTPTGIVVERVSAVARPLRDGRILLVGRSRRELQHLTRLVGRALSWGLIPAVILALAAGTWASHRTLARVAAFRAALDRIIDGGLRERLPSHGTSDTLDILAGSVNRTLEQVERLLDEVGGVGDSIAHDLRTPLARMRARLEGGRRRATSLAALDGVVGQAIGDLDQCFTTMTALLRIGELEAAERRSGFAEVSLSAIVAEVGDLYQPMAELRGLSFEAVAVPGQTVRGDRDLLFEVCANLLDNAVKFAPDAGAVSLLLEAGAGGPVLSVQDSGDGIVAQEREAVLKRFHRVDRSSRFEGSGLGLSLVAAILRLHGFTLRMRDLRPGFAVEVLFGKARPDAHPLDTADA